MSDNELVHEILSQIHQAALKIMAEMIEQILTDINNGGHL